MNHKIILFLTLILFISCDTKTVEVEVNSKGGMAYQGDSKGKKFSFGSDEDAKIAVDLILAFAKKDTETMASSMADSVRYMPPQGSKPIMASSKQINEIVEFKNWSWYNENDSAYLPWYDAKKSVYWGHERKSAAWSSWSHCPTYSPWSLKYKSSENGNVASSLVVAETDEIILSTDKGSIMRCAVKEIRIAGRNTQGVRIIKLSGDEKVVSAIKLDDNLI